MLLYFNQDFCLNITITMSNTFAKFFILMDALTSRHLWSSFSHELGTNSLKISILLLLTLHMLFLEWCKLKTPHWLPSPPHAPHNKKQGGFGLHLWLVLITQTSGNHLSALRHTNRMIYRPGLCVFLNLILIYLK